tara:strand:- start:22846 stop:23877 length:1032 start_codon:yes stop_codon:yes gene_type:complete
MSSKVVNDLRDRFGNNITATEVKRYAREEGISYPTVTRKLENFKVKRGTWDLTVQEARQQLEESFTEMVSAVPAVDPNFVQFGNFNRVKKIVKSGTFYPTFITGLSGNGKTFSVEQACAQLKRELIRVNITIETDEDDLIGGFRLVNGETVWHNGPVIEALQRGAVLLLDEIDLASNKILCLQSILEGKGVFLKKIGKYVTPAEGFNVFATANTKGKGSEDGRFIGTNVLNEAFLERFPVTFEQEYPSAVTEAKILSKLCKDTEFVNRLADWADIIRKTFFEGGIDEIISTRRLVHIVRAYDIFNDRMEALQLCLNRFDDETKASFLDLYTKIDDKVETPENV